MPYPCRHISTSVACDMHKLYRFASDPRNLPLWASGLSEGEMRQENGAWYADAPMGRVQVEFAPANDYGILDHAVTLADGTAFHNPMRVFANGDGCEVVFTLLEQVPMTAEALEADAQTILKDLLALKRLMET